MTAADDVSPAAASATGSGAPTSVGHLDEFRLLRALGHGGMGTVFLGHDTILDRLVAIKLIRTRAADEASRLRFLTEARAIARLSHPNVVTIFRTATTRAGQPYIAQEWISGQSLDMLPRPLDPRRAAEIGLGIARGLAAAHRRGILHRDVKPANVMIDDGGTPKLLDFGLAKLSWFDREEAASWDQVRSATASGTGQTATPTAETAETADAASATPSAELATTLGDPAPPLPTAARVAAAVAAGLEPIGPAEPLEHTVSGAVLGTPRYLAPEVWRGEPATARSDVYSFGVLLYELIAGVPPYPQEGRAALEDAVLHGPAARPLGELATGADPELAELIASCLSREPARRPESADEIAHRLERILSGAPAIPEGNPYPGLAPFDAEHRAVFYGRGADVSAVVDRLRGEPVVTVAGDSGIGKSSLCRAGVVPAVESGGLGDGRAWQVRAVAIGRHGAGALREALGLGDLAAEPSAADLRQALGLDEAHGLLLFIDQFEEIVTSNDPARAAEAARLLATLAEGVPGLKLLVAVRGDFLTRVASLPEIGPLLTRSLHVLRVLGPADAREAVLGPARARGVRFESDAMVQQLTSSIDDSPGALPLLQFALAELWHRRDADRHIIPRDALDQVGGVAGGLARHADGVLFALGAGERAAARRILLGLVSREGTRTSRERSELADEPVAGAALEALVRGRLLVARDAAGGEPLYTLAHESLIDAWVTLRGWLDDAAGQRGLRTRLGAAADEWHRLARRGDLLWSRDQVAETAGLDELTERDRRFLAASRRAFVRRRAVRLAFAASIPIAVLATWAGFRIRDQANRDEIVARHLAAAAEQVRSAEHATGEARAGRVQAMQLFDSNATKDGEERWRDVVAAALTGQAALRTAASELEAALLTDAARTDVRAHMARVLFQQALLAEEQRDHAATAEIVKRLEAYDDGTLLAEWRRPAALAVDAPGAVQIEVRPYVDRDGRLELGPAVASSAGHALEAVLPAGSYSIDLRGADGLRVPFPVLLSRDERVVLSTPLPRASQIPDGFIYVPPGRFLTGSNADESLRRDFLVAPPLHATSTGPYLIARHEVTFGEWMDYMRALPPAEREERRPRSQDETGLVMSIHLDGDGPFSLTLRRAGKVHRAAEGEPLVFAGRRSRREVRWERSPVTAVSFDDARAYAAWLSASGRVAGARLCSEMEWERAARGADGRNLPHGERTDPDDANIDVTYGRDPLGFGPDEVGSHPRSNSPFGVADMMGNVWEWVPGPDESVMFRGGGWYFGISSALITNHDFAEPAMRSLISGIRLCAEAPPVP